MNKVGCGCMCCTLVDLNDNELVEVQITRGSVENVYPFNMVEAHTLMHMFTSSECCFE